MLFHGSGLSHLMLIGLPCFSLCSKKQLPNRRTSTSLNCLKNKQISDWVAKEIEGGTTLAIGHTVQSGSASQVQDNILGANWSGDVCVVGDGAEAMAIAGLLSSQISQVANCHLTMLGGVTPPHIEFASALSLQAQRRAVQPAELGGARTAGGATVSAASCYYGAADIPFSKKSHDVEE